MADQKAAGVVFIRNKLRELDAQAEQRYLERLDESERQIFESVLTMSWLDVHMVDRLIENGLDILFPDQRNPAHEFGRIQAHHDLGGIYKILLAIATVPMVIKQTAKLWKTYHRQGEATVVQPNGGNAGTMEVRGYPDLPVIARTVTTGYVRGALERTRASNIEVAEDFSDPELWRWKASWS